MTYWFVPIIIGVLLLAVFWLIIDKIYKKHLDSDNDILGIALMQGACNMTETFQFSERFISIKCHLVIKFVIFLVLGLVTHFSDSISFSGFLLILLLVIQGWMTHKRMQEYKCFDEDIQKNLKPVLTSFFLVTVYQTILLILNLAIFWCNV